MTLVIDRPVAGPATHVLLVGVGHYRHLPGGEGPFLNNTLGLGQLDCPPLSVQELLTFFATRYRRPSAPLATVEVVRSPAGPVALPDGSSVAVDGATMGDVKAAIQDWFTRCNENPDNVAVFYFCGHGVERADQYLLMEDFGAFAPSLLDNTLDLEGFHRGMSQCVAGTQLFLIDACREVPRELRQFVTGGVGQVVLDDKGGNLARDAPILRAAASGRKAFATEGQSTRFAQALVQSLAGAAAAQDGDDPQRWVVRFNNLASTMGQLLRAGPADVPRQEVRTGGEAGDALVQEIEGTPLVPVVVECAPSEFASLATLELRDKNGAARYSRDPAPGLWQLLASADFYQLCANLQPPLVAQPQNVAVWPPRRSLKVAITQ